MWIVYSLIIWVVCVVYLFKKLNGPFTVTSEEYLLALVPVIAVPVGIYYIRKGLIYFYDQKQKKEETNLALLRKEQKEKVEELKKKTSYYTTQSLLERYDEALAAKKKMDEKAAVKKLENNQDLRQRKPVSMPAQSQPQPQPTFPRSPIPQQFSPPPQRYPNQQMVAYQTKSEPQWYDKLIDALVGDAGPETKYALICAHCFAHNGLVLKEEYDIIQYICPFCKQFNPSRKSKQDLSKAILEESEETKEEVKEETKEETKQETKEKDVVVINKE
ncbi:hypothetical protein G6F43_001665 [Rhizopus delemar]|nr:hypothetical protein G6F43_001665 [Rhizopus delemar]